jgi:hypothetical protein
MGGRRAWRHRVALDLKDLAGRHLPPSAVASLRTIQASTRHRLSRRRQASGTGPG